MFVSRNRRVTLSTGYLLSELLARELSVTPWGLFTNNSFKFFDEGFVRYSDRNIGGVRVPGSD